MLPGHTGRGRVITGSFMYMGRGRSGGEEREGGRVWVGRWEEKAFRWIGSRSR